MKSFGELLRDYRLRRKLTQQELADRLGLSSPYIAQMESGFKPPPPQMLVEKISTIVQLSRDEGKKFSEIAEKERELQSLVKATRKSGYILAGNKVCVPEKAVNYRLQNELDKIIKSIPRGSNFSIDIPRSKGIGRNNEGENTLNSPAEMQAWILLQLSDRLTEGLIFLGYLFDVLLLTPDERVLCRQPTPIRSQLIEQSRMPGEFFKTIFKLIIESKQLADEQKIPDVIAPHEVWRNIDDVLGSDKQVKLELTTPKQKNKDQILNVPIVGAVEQGNDQILIQKGMGFIGLPMNWFNEDLEYEASHVLTDAYASIGIWPGCKAIYEIGGPIESEDLVVVQIGEDRFIRKYFDMGDQIILQGGPQSRPIRINKEDDTIKIIGVIRELVSRIREITE